MSDPIPLDVLATWLAVVGLVADWTVYAEGPVLAAIRVVGQGETEASE